MLCGIGLSLSELCTSACVTGFTFKMVVSLQAMRSQAYTCNHDYFLLISSSFRELWLYL